MSWYFIIGQYLSQHVEKSSIDPGNRYIHCAMDDIHNIYILLKKR